MDELAAPLREVLQGLKKKWAEFQNEEPLWSVVMGFVHAIDWKERWIQALLAAQVGLLLVTVLTRKHATIQGTIFVAAMTVVYKGELLNELARKHWQEFSQQDYFDRPGIFFNVMISAPLLLGMFIIVINYLLACVGLLVKAKRMQIRHQAKQRGQTGDAGAGPSTTDGSKQSPGTKKAR